MTLSRFLLAALFLGCLPVLEPYGFAQGTPYGGSFAARPPLRGANRYQPSSPTTSPYLNLLRPNFGVYPNYYSLVRPMRRQREFNLREQRLRIEQSNTLGGIQGELRQSLEGGRSSLRPTGTGSGYMIPGSRSTFMNSSRYYPQSGAAGRGR